MRLCPYLHVCVYVLQAYGECEVSAYMDSQLTDWWGDTGIYPPVALLGRWLDNSCATSRASKL